MARRRLRFVLLLGALSFGCGVNGSGSLLVGAEGTGGNVGSGGQSPIGAGGNAVPPIAIGNAGRSEALSAHIEQNRVQVTFVTVACAGGCADVEAVATGGTAPYDFVWEDGTTSAARHVCPTATTEYEVTVTDQGFAGEIRRPPQMAIAPLTAQVLACPGDAGADRDAGRRDAAVPPAPDVLCVANPSFEGSTFLGPTPEWTYCKGGAAGLNVTGGALQASDGTAAIGLMANSVDSVATSIQATLCTPLRAGAATRFSVDLTMSGIFGPFGTAYLELWGAKTPCSKDELLWTSSLISKIDGWEAYCGTLSPSQDYPYVILVPSVTSPDPAVPPAGGGYMALDNFGSKGACKVP